MENTGLRTKAVKEGADAAVWKTGSHGAAVLTHQLTGVNSGCLVGFPGNAYGDEKEVSMKSVYSQL